MLCSKWCVYGPEGLEGLPRGKGTHYVSSLVLAPLMGSSLHEDIAAQLVDYYRKSDVNCSLCHLSRSLGHLFHNSLQIILHEFRFLEFRSEYYSAHNL